MPKQVISFMTCLMSFAVGLAITDLISPPNKPPHDLLLINTYQTHRQAFDILTKMGHEDSHIHFISASYAAIGDNSEAVTYLDETESLPDPESIHGFTKERWDNYRTLFKNLGLDYGIERKSVRRDAIFFTASIDTCDLDDTETLYIEKGYVYAPVEITDSVVDSLDDIQVYHPAMFFRKLSDHWYLYYEWSIGKPE